MPPPPRTWKDLQTHPYREGFRTAATKEYQDLERRNTFKSVPKTSKITTLPLIWVFTYKFNTDGYLIRFKARLCVRGDLQPLTNRDNYAATLAARPFRAVMAITAAFDLETLQADAVKCFYKWRPGRNDLLRIVQKDSNYPVSVYGYSAHAIGYAILHFYGLRNSQGQLTKLGLIQIREDICLFTNDSLIVFSYVDDIVSLCHMTDLPKLH